jgi:hypothetical protein
MTDEERESGELGPGSVAAGPAIDLRVGPGPSGWHPERRPQAFRVQEAP